MEGSHHNASGVSRTGYKIDEAGRGCVCFGLPQSETLCPWLPLYLTSRSLRERDGNLSSRRPTVLLSRRLWQMAARVML